MFYKGEIPLVRLLVPLITGISLAYFFPDEGIFKSAIPVALISLFIFAILVFNYRKFSIYKSKWIAGFISHFFILTTGYWLTVHSSERFNKEHYSFQKSEAFVAEIRTEPRLSKNILRFEAQITEHYNKGEKNLSAGKIVISVQVDSLKTSQLKYGDILLISAKYNNIDPPYNPGEFDYKAYLADRQIYYQAFLSQNQINLIDRGKGNSTISFALELRKQLVDKFHNYLPDKNAAAFASTLILGYRAELSRELVEAYSKTGTMHVLSVSGMHVGIVFLVLSVIFKFMDKTQGTRLIRAFLVISIIWFYAMLTGFSAPASRAAVMLSFIVLGKALGKNQNTYNLIAISAFFLLLYNPFYLVDAGFQLSYLAVTGLVYFHPKIYQSFYIKNKFLDYVWSYSALSIAAQLATFPFSIYYFHQFPVYFLFSNLFIVFPVAIIMYLGIIFMFIPFSMILYYAGLILNRLINWTNNILYYIENLPFSSWDGIWINAFECTLICLLIVCTSLRLSYGYRKLMVPIGALLIVLFSSFSMSWVRDYNQHEIVFYNLRRNTGIAYVNKWQSIIISDVVNTDKLLNFSILPTVQSKGSRMEIFHRTDERFSGNSYSGDENFYQFGDYRIIRWDKNFDKINFSQTLTVDVVLISGNPSITLEDISSCLNFDRVIIDANNPDYKIERWVAESRRMNLRCDVLKKNPALVVKL